MLFLPYTDLKEQGNGRMTALDESHRTALSSHAAPADSWMVDSSLLDWLQISFISSIAILLYVTYVYIDVSILLYFLEKSKYFGLDLWMEKLVIYQCKSRDVLYREMDSSGVVLLTICYSQLSHARLFEKIYLFLFPWQHTLLLYISLDSCTQHLYWRFGALFC